MTPEFDPYQQWLGIGAEERPISHYRLLGLPDFTSDEAKIHQAALTRIATLRKHQAGKHSDQSQQLMNEVSEARLLLLDATRKADYDFKLQLAQQVSHSFKQPAAQSDAESPMPVILVSAVLALLGLGLLGWFFMAPPPTSTASVSRSELTPLDIDGPVLPATPTPAPPTPAPVAPKAEPVTEPKVEAPMPTAPVVEPTPKPVEPVVPPVEKMAPENPAPPAKPAVPPAEPPAEPTTKPAAPPMPEAAPAVASLTNWMIIGPLPKDKLPSDQLDDLPGLAPKVWPSIFPKEGEKFDRQIPLTWQTGGQYAGAAGVYILAGRLELKKKGKIAVRVQELPGAGALWINKERIMTAGPSNVWSVAGRFRSETGATEKDLNTGKQRVFAIVTVPADAKLDFKIEFAEESTQNPISLLPIDAK